MAEYQGCDNCSNQGKSMFDYPCFECTHNRATDHWKPITNADRIRNMSDEELAEFLCEVYDDDESCGKFINGIVIPYYCENSIKEWLQAEVKEGAEC